MLSARLALWEPAASPGRRARLEGGAITIVAMGGSSLLTAVRTESKRLLSGCGEAPEAAHREPE